MLHNKRTSTLLALAGALALMVSAPAFAQNTATPAAAAAPVAVGGATAAADNSAAAPAAEVELSRQAGLKVDGEHRDTTIMRAQTAVGAVQSSLARRLSSGMQFLATVGSTGPFIGLFGTVFGIMNSFIGIANTNTTNLAVVAPARLVVLVRSEEHTSELQSHLNLVCRLLLYKNKIFSSTLPHTLPLTITPAST